MLQMSQDERISRSRVEFIDDDDDIMNHKDYATFFSNQFNNANQQKQQEQYEQQVEQELQQQKEIEMNVTRTIK
jgi:hypothetical protein